MDRKEYAKQYWQKPEVKETKKLSQRVVYASEKGQSYEYKRRRTANSRFLRAQCNARTRKKEWTLTLEEFTAFIVQPCTYCGGSLAEETGSSLDRKDNERGYHNDNVNPCCKSCNRRRSKSMAADVFKEQFELNKQGKE